MARRSGVKGTGTKFAGWVRSSGVLFYLAEVIALWSRWIFYERLNFHFRRRVQGAASGESLSLSN